MDIKGIKWDNAKGSLNNTILSELNKQQRNALFRYVLTREKTTSMVDRKCSKEGFKKKVTEKKAQLLHKAKK